MKLYTAASTLALAVSVNALPSKFTSRQTNSTSACASAVSLDATTNVFSTHKLHANNFYKAEVVAAAANMTDTSLATAAAAVADVGSFLWLDTIEHIARLEPAIAEVPCEDILGVVIYDLPGRDCNAKASNGELATGEVEKYKTDYVDGKLHHLNPLQETPRTKKHADRTSAIATILKANPNTAFALLIEPDSLPNLVTNSDNPLCAAAESDYKTGVAYALTTLNLPNVVMYMDAGHGGWLGWNDNITPGAEMLAGVYKDAGSPSQLRGISTNVAGWNSWDGAAEFSSGDGQYNKAQNEKLYVGLIGPALATAGMPNHAIIDTSR